MENNLTRAQFLVLSLLIVIFILACWLRLDAVNWSLPFRFHPDEWKYVSGAARCLEGDWNPRYFRNPPGYTYVNALWYPLWLHIQWPVEVPNWLGIDPVRLRLSTDPVMAFRYRPFDLVLGARLISVLFGAMTTIIVFLIGRDLSNVRVGILAAALTAVSFANVRESHFAVNDPSMTFMLTLALWLGIRACRVNSIRYFWGACAVGGGAVAFKYNAFTAVIALLIIWFIQYFRHGLLSEHFWKMKKELAVGLLLSIACFFIICPFPITDTDTFMKEMDKLSAAAKTGWPGQEKIWSGFLFVESLFRSEGVFAVIFSIAGMAILVIQKKWEWIVFPTIYLVLICVHPLYFMRFSLPVLPWFSLTAAYSIDYISSVVINEKVRKVLPAALLLLCMAEPLLKDFRLNYLLKQEDNRIRCLKWFLKQPFDGFITADQYAFPIPYRGVAEPWSTPLHPRAVSIDHVPSNRLEEFETNVGVKADYVAVSTFAAFPGYIDESYQERRNSLKEFAGEGKRNAFFTVFYREKLSAKKYPEPADVEDTYSPVTNLWGRSRAGPEIEVFKVEKQR